MRFRIRPSQKVFTYYFFIDLFVISLVFLLTYIFKYNSLSGILTNIRFPNIKEYSFIFVLWYIFIVIIFKRKSLYTTDRSLTIPREVFKLVTSISYTVILISAVIFFAQYKFFSREVFLEDFLLLCLTLSGWRIIKRLILRRLIAEGFHNINLIIIGAGRLASMVVREIRNNPHWGFRIVGFLEDGKTGSIEGIPILGKLRDFKMAAKKYFVDDIIVTIPSAKKPLSELLIKAKDMRLGFNIIPENFEEPLAIPEITYLGLIPMLSYKKRSPHPTEFALKRFLDFFIALFLLIAFLPLGIIIAVLIKLDSKGPVFYARQRAGYKNRNFVFYKFRSMVVDAEKRKGNLLEKNEVQDGVLFKIRNDPRITRVGRFIRKHSLDEMPQLLNVLKGDMSLVGPRPPVPEEVQKYSYDCMQRLSVRPGITCLPQVRGRSDLSFRRWAKWDLWYINHWSFLLDFKILWWTLDVVLKGKGAY